MIIFVNGKIGGGSPAAGVPYWTVPSTPFVSQARHYLKDSKTLILEIDHDVWSTAEERFDKGYHYCCDNINDIACIVSPGDTIKLIAHSMGCSFAEGMAQYLIEKGNDVSTMIHINAFQAGQMEANKNIAVTIDFQYTDDIILKLPFVSCVGDIKGAIAIREKSHLWIRRRHRGPIYPNSNNFWHSVEEYI